MSPRYGMVIDLVRCVACDACTMACRQAKATGPDVLLAKVLKYEVGRYPNSRLGYLPILCNQCDRPACVEVCPRGAAQKLDNGVVVIDQDKCVGCQACVVACPYGARSGFKPVAYYFSGHQTPFEELRARENRTGKVQKCDFCIDRVNLGRQPACVEACPAEARIFGDLNDPESRVSRLSTQAGSFRLRPELETGPAVFYLRHTKET